MRSCDALVEAAADVAASSTPEGRLLRLAALRHAVDAAMVSALADIETSPGAVRLDGGTDGAQWLAARSDLHPAEAKTLAGLAHALPDMPATSLAYDQGRIGTEKARLMASATHVHGFEDAEPGLVARLAGVSLRAARRIVGRFIADNTDTEPTDPAANEVTLAPKRDGRWALRGDLDAATATVLRNELRRLADAHRDDEDLRAPRRTTWL
jgi:hypothetical protein